MTDLHSMNLRLDAAERELARAQACIRELRGQVAHDARVRTIAGSAVVAAAVAASALWSATTQAQGPARGSTLKAPFSVVDAAGRAIVEITDSAEGRGIVVRNRQGGFAAHVIADARGDGALIARNGKTEAGSGIHFAGGEPEFALKTSDDKLSIYLRREGSTIIGPLTVTDTAGKPVMTAQAESTSQVSDAKGQVKTVTTSRGLHIFNPKGAIVARAAADADGNGYVLARDASGAATTAGMIVTRNGSQLALTGTDGKTRAAVKSSEGFVIYNAQGTPVGAMSAVKDKGYLELNDAAGQKMVETSAGPDGKGYVLVYPWQVSVSAMGDPSVLRGGRKP